MSRFIDDVNRMFDELLSTPWKQHRPTVRHPGPAGPDSVWELEVPVTGGDPERFGIQVQGEQVVVTVGGRSTREEQQGGQGHVTAERYAERQQSFRLPPGARIGAIEARFEGQSLWLRIRLRQ